MDNNSYFGMIVLLFVTVIFCALLIIEKEERKYLQKQAIELNYANYNPTNGVWQWKINK
jgi:hypothetical protein